jgi:hypothetical protein
MIIPVPMPVKEEFELFLAMTQKVFPPMAVNGALICKVVDTLAPGAIKNKVAAGDPDQPAGGMTDKV